MKLFEFLKKVDGKESDIRGLSGEEALKEVERDGLALQFVAEHTEEMCLAAVNQDGYALQYVREQTPGVCLAAMKQKGYALQYVREQTDCKD